MSNPQEPAETPASWTRRGWLSAAGAGLMGTAFSAEAAPALPELPSFQPSKPAPLALTTVFPVTVPRARLLPTCTAP